MFNIGDYITIKKEYSDKGWYHNGQMLIIKIELANNDQSIYMVEGTYSEDIEYLQKQFKRVFSHNHIELSVAHIRYGKLERILNV